MDKERLEASHQRKRHLVLQILKTLVQNQTCQALCSGWTQEVPYTPSWTQIVRAYWAAFKAFKDALQTFYTLWKKTSESPEEGKESCYSSKQKMEPTSESKALS